MDANLTIYKKLQGFQLIAQEKLQSIICSIPGKKNLILEPTLIKPLEHVCTASWLKLKGIQRIYKYDEMQIIVRNAEQVQLYMIRSELKLFKSLLRHLQLQLSTGGRGGAAAQYTEAEFKRFHIICVPSCFVYFETLLEQEGLHGYVELHRYNWDFIYLDQCLLSLEWRNVFGNVFIQHDSSMLPAIAQSLRVLQIICGRPELIISYGEQACNIVKMLQAFGGTTSAECNELGAILIIDRDKDYASSLLTPSIYAALLLEVFQQRAGEISIETTTNKVASQQLRIFQQAVPTTKKLSTKTAGSKPVTIRMNAQADEIYGDNRYKHFTQASSLVRAQAKSIGLEVQKLNDMKLDEMHDYVARKLPKITETKTKLLRHLNASEIVIEMLAANFRRVQSLEEDILNNVTRKRLLTEIDELLTTDGQRYNTLRLMCLLHLCSGLAADELQQFARTYCNYFGHEHLCTFQQLAAAGLLPPILAQDDKLQKSAKLLSNLPIPKFQQTEFQANSNRLKLLVSNTTETNNPSSEKGTAATTATTLDTCPSFVFNGLYIPLIAQLCSILLKCNNAEELCLKLGMLDKLQMFQASDDFATPLSIKQFASQVKNAESNDFFPMRMRNIFVYIVGGVTYAEVGACDLISKLTGAQIIVAGDCMLAGCDLIGAAAC